MTNVNKLFVYFNANIPNYTKKSEIIFDFSSPQQIFEALIQ